MYNILVYISSFLVIKQTKIKHIIFYSFLIRWIVKHRLKNERWQQFEKEWIYFYYIEGIPVDKAISFSVKGMYI